MTPDRAILVYGLRSSDVEYLKELIERFEKIVQGCALATGATYTIRTMGPMYATTKFNHPLMELAYEVLTQLGVKPKHYEETTKSVPRVNGFRKRLTDRAIIGDNL